MNMAKTVQKLVHAPNLNTILMVERTLKSMPGSVMTVAELKRRLPKQVNHIALMHVLEYLEQSGKIYCGLKGMTWVHNANQHLRQAIAQGTLH
jgi:hypothetical protein